MDIHTIGKIFEVLEAVKMSIVGFWFVMPYSFVSDN
jgi:hypothetical protein